MTAPDPFVVLGIEHDATLADARLARRRLAFECHPDRGGNADDMRTINAAFDAVVAHLTGRRPLTFDEPDVASQSPAPAGQPPERQPRGRQPQAREPQQRSGRAQHDSPSFVIAALPAEAFEALLVVTSWIGEVLVDDPPYVLETHLYEPSECWCRLDLVPDAGSSTVSLTVASSGTIAPPSVDDVRDVWVFHLNRPGAFA